VTDNRGHTGLAPVEVVQLQWEQAGRLDELRAAARAGRDMTYPAGWASNTEHPAGTREFMTKAAEGRHPGTAQILVHFSWAHLPDRLQSYSRVMADLALQMVARLPDGPELTAGLRKLLEAKDCFVRAANEAA
jgi:hypothetical protein